MKKKIVFADDAPESRNFFKIVFNESPYEVIMGTTGKEAIDLFHTEKPDMIIVDLFMPEMNGIQVVKEIRKTDKKIPVIGISGAHLDETPDEMKELGFTDFLSKPVNKLTMLETIKKHI